jgi:hypothetical protein
VRMPRLQPGSGGHSPARIAREGMVEERPQYGPGRPRRQQPRPVQAMRYGLQPTRQKRSEVLARKRQEAACFVLLTHVPTTGARAPRAKAGLGAYKTQPGVAQNCAFLQNPLFVHRLFLQQPARIEALGLVFWLALLLGPLGERALRVHVETPGNALTGWDKKSPQKPMAVMMMTKFAAVLVVQGGAQRQLAQPLSAVQQQYLLALGVPATSCTVPRRGERRESGRTRTRATIAGRCWREGLRGCETVVPEDRWLCNAQVC